MTHDPSTCDDRHCTVFACKLAYWRREGLRLDPRATPTRMNKVAGHVGDNSWEKGIAKDHRGMPYLERSTLEPLSVKEFSNRRHEFVESPLKVS